MIVSGLLVTSIFLDAALTVLFSDDFLRASLLEFWLLSHEKHKIPKHKLNVYTVFFIVLTIILQNYDFYRKNS
jgi:hypothetical protein